MSSTRILAGSGSSGQNRRPEKVPMKPSQQSIRPVEHGSRLGNNSPWGSAGRSSIGASTGTGGGERARGFFTPTGGSTGGRGGGGGGGAGGGRAAMCFSRAGGEARGGGGGGAAP